MDAQCNGCGGRVMPYAQYVMHFRPTAECGSCGERVRMRYYPTILFATMVSVSVLVIVVLLTRSIPIALAGLALGVLLAFLADFWTFRNLGWDLDDPDGGSTEASA